MNKKQSQSGGGHLIIIIIAAVVLILGGLGYVYWDSVQKKAAADKAAQALIETGLNNANKIIEAAGGTTPIVVDPVIAPVITSTCVADKAAALEPYSSQIASLQAEVTTLTSSVQQQIALGSMSNIATTQSEITRLSAEITSLQSQIMTETSKYDC